MAIYTHKYIYLLCEFDFIVLYIMQVNIGKIGRDFEYKVNNFS